MLSIAVSAHTSLVPPVSQYLTRSVLSLDVDDSLRDAARLLRMARITGAPVTEDGSLRGILSRNDLLRRLAQLDGTATAEKFETDLKAIQNEDVYDVMADSPVTIVPTATLVDAAQVLSEKKLNRLMVKAKYGSMLGILSSTDVVFGMLNINAQDAEGIKVEDYRVQSSAVEPRTEGPLEECSLDSSIRGHMATDLTVMSPTQTLKEAGLLFRAASVTGAPVVQDGKLVGVLSRNDLLKALLEIPADASADEYAAAVERVGNKPVSDVMSASPQTVSADVSMLEAAKIMAREKLNRLMVTDEEGGLIGLVSSTDVCFAMLGCDFTLGDDDEGLDDIDWAKRTGNLYRKGIY
jgi:CBS domain-containing protein